jgi:NAD(P)-dependent dehydrogenase (short-subunit alcohol dehydrogenase family)
VTIRFDNRVAIVTGAGGGLGRQYALDLAARGCRVVVNDLGGARDGTGGSTSMAEQVVAEIAAAGGEGVPNGASVTDPEGVAAMVEEARDRWGRVDILINNAGILRDRTFAKMSLEDFRAVIEVHLIGSVICTHAVWEMMRNSGYGRVLMTTSSSGLYGSFGQSNYAAAKLGLVGLTKTLALEGAKSGVHVNAIAPVAFTRMTEDLPIPPEIAAKIGPETVSPAALWLVSEEAPTGMIMAAGGGGFEASHVTLTRGIHVGEGEMTPETVAARIDAIRDREGELVPETGAAQLMTALAAAGRE